MVQLEHEPRQLLVGAVLMAVTAMIQTFGVVALEELVERVRGPVTHRTTRTRMLAVLCPIILYLFALHLLEICIWAGFYLAVTDYRTLAVAMYESALAFTTMDIAHLPPNWKYLSAAEGVTGLLMFAWSTGVLFNQTSWVTEARRKYIYKTHLFGLKEVSPPPGP